MLPSRPVLLRHTKPCANESFSPTEESSMPKAGASSFAAASRDGRRSESHLRQHRRLILIGGKLAPNHRRPRRLGRTSSSLSPV